MVYQKYRDIKNILVIRTDRIGDVVLTLPIADVLKEHYNDINVDYLVNKRCQDIAASAPNINNVITIENDTFQEIYKTLKEKKYDIAIVVRPLFNIAAALFILNIKYKLGTGYRWYSFLFNIRHYQHRKYSEKHELEYNIDLLKSLGINTDKKYYPKIIVKQEALTSLFDKHDTLRNSEYIIIHPFSLGSALKWEPEKFVELVHKLLSDNDFKHKIVITGTHQDKEQNAELIERLLKHKNIVLIFDLQINELISLISKAKAFVSNSTGPIHLAAALGVFVFGIYSPVLTESPVRWAPCTEKKVIFVPDIKEHSNSKYVDLQLIMEQITIEEVYKSIINYLKSFKNEKN